MTTDKTFPANWHVAADFNPNEQMMSLKGKDYLSVQSRMVWFVRDQRALIAAGLATQPYRVLSDIVEIDRAQGWAHFRATVCDVLGNESVAYGSESAKDFGDFIEKAATKALGRALVFLGYGTGMAPEMDEGERVVDSPIERKSAPKAASQPASKPTPPASAATPAAPAAESDPIARALKSADILQLLNKLDHRDAKSQRAALEQVQEALASVRKPWNGDNVRAELRRMIAQRDAQAKASGYDLASLGAGAGRN